MLLHFWTPLYELFHITEMALGKCETMKILAKKEMNPGPKHNKSNNKSTNNWQRMILI